MHFIFDLIRKILRAKLHGEVVVLWGDGQQKRELIYVSDFVDIAFRISGNISGEVVNVGAGQEYTIKYFAEEICSIIGYDADRIQYDATRYVGAKSKCLDIRKLNSYAPSWKQLSLRDGLQNTISWFMDHEIFISK
jgi:GDP-L-fucose synthase